MKEKLRFMFLPLLLSLFTLSALKEKTIAEVLSSVMERLIVFMVIPH